MSGQWVHTKTLASDPTRLDARTAVFAQPDTPHNDWTYSRSGWLYRGGQVVVSGTPTTSHGGWDWVPSGTQSPTVAPNIGPPTPLIISTAQAGEGISASLGSTAIAPAQQPQEMQRGEVNPAIQTETDSAFPMLSVGSSNNALIMLAAIVLAFIVARRVLK